MKVTVCQLHGEPGAFARDWDRLVAYAKAERSELVLLPEMPFISVDVDLAVADRAKSTYPRDVIFDTSVR